MLDLRDSTGADWSMTLKPDDRLFVRSVTRWHERLQVTVSGEARYPGSYVIDRDSTTLRAVIDRAGGFTAEASLQESFVLRANTTISIDPEYERLKLVPAPDMTPDEYEYFKMKSRERRGLLTVDFQRLFKTGDVSQDVVLKNGDQIFIEKNRETVVVTGAVASPGGVIYNPRLTVNDYILRAGGYGWNARRNKTRVIRAKTGEWVWAGKAGILGPGDTVWVPEKPYRDWWNIFLQGLTTAGQVATIILVVDTVRR
jgi:protein involved in polysaccharide export with SLBB domain